MLGLAARSTPDNSVELSLCRCCQMKLTRSGAGSRASQSIFAMKLSVAGGQFRPDVRSTDPLDVRSTDVSVLQLAVATGRGLCEG
jgi:hypothetical protein